VTIARTCSSTGVLDLGRYFERERHGEFVPNQYNDPFDIVKSTHESDSFGANRDSLGLTSAVGWLHDRTPSHILIESAMQAVYQYDVFISYVHESCGKFAVELCERLQGSKNQNGAPARIFIDRELRPGVDFAIELAQVIRNSRHFLALLTRDYFSQRYCVFEFREAFKVDPDERDLFIVPLLVEDAAKPTIPAHYDHIHYVSRNLNPKGWYEKICQSLDLIDPRNIGLESAEKLEEPTPRHDQPTRTPDGFLVVQGVHFAEVPGVYRSFWISRTPITVEQYRRIAGAQRMPSAPPGNPNWAYPDHPIVLLNWDEANEFCKNLGGRLPSFQDWYFASGPSQISPQTAGPSGFRVLDLDAGTQRTGLSSDKVPNLYGIYDLIGNVWEWCADPGPAPNDRSICGGYSSARAQQISKARRLPAVGFRCFIENRP
jgi:hypothetical protein